MHSPQVVIFWHASAVITGAGGLRMEAQLAIAITHKRSMEETT
jgi:hypothetical protein